MSYQENSAARALFGEEVSIESLLAFKKLVDMGWFATGVMHDIGSVFTHSEYFNVLLGEACEAGASAEEIQGLLKRQKLVLQKGRSISRTLINRTKGVSEERTIVSFEDLIKETIETLSPVFTSSTSIFFENHTKKSHVFGCEIHLQQVLGNILCNAHNALMGRSGVISITLESVKHEERKGVLPDTMLDGRYLKLSITDTGKGMDEATLKKIGTLFFTTRADEGGTGTGLSLVKVLLNLHRGFLEVKSSFGEGSTFTIFLPEIT